MKPINVTFEIQQDGQKSRLFRFAEAEITIGFSARCNLSLEPYADPGAELAVITQSEPCLLRVKSGPGAFSLNGTPCVADMPVKSGDVITSNSYRIVIRNLPEAAVAAQPAAIEPNAEPSILPENAAVIESEKKAAEPEDEALTRAATASAIKAETSGAAPQKKTGLSYLYLFFAPVQEYLSDDDVAEVLINGPKQIYIERKGKLALVPAKFANDQALQAAVMNVARSVGRFFDKDNPRLDARLPDGSRVHAVMPPLSRVGTIVAIRKFRREKMTIQQLID